MASRLKYAGCNASPLQDEELNGAVVECADTDTTVLTSGLAFNSNRRPSVEDVGNPTITGVDEV